MCRHLLWRTCACVNIRHTAVLVLPSELRLIRLRADQQKASTQTRLIGANNDFSFILDDEDKLRVRNMFRDVLELVGPTEED